MKYLIAFAVGVAMLGPVSAEARKALQDDQTIENGLVIISIGRMLYKGCGDIQPRRLKALGFATSLHNRAQSLGYSRSEIDAYLDSEEDKARVVGKAQAYLRSKGATLSDPASVCAIGRDEIESETSVGKYLRID